ncbi:MAG: hypothetical protein AAGA24_01040 [Pseudomonadota bacterium]
MLLRRITQHVKEQNWTAVWLDFTIVVVGVFLGLQFANWNEARKDAAVERQILERLHSELKAAEASQTTYNDLAETRLKHADIARQVLFGVADRDTLTPHECEILATVHIPPTLPTVIPILEELSASGRLALITDESVVRLITALSVFDNQSDPIANETRPSRVVLPNTFPDLIRYSLIANPDSADRPERFDTYNRIYTCDSDAMRQNPAFLNAAGLNIATAIFFWETNILPKRKALKDLREAVEAALGVT